MCATHLTKIDFKVIVKTIVIENVIARNYHVIFFFLQNVSDDVIEYILMMLSHSILEKYPIKTSYLVKLLKTIINQV